MPVPDGHGPGRVRSLVAVLAVMFAVYVAIVPLGRSCLQYQIAYNEGWNVYNANTVAQHGLLYPAAFGWTNVNYPGLSFFVVAELQRLTHDLLFTARAVSTASTFLCSLLAGLVVWQLTRVRWAAFLAAVYCFALFCASADT